MPANFTSLSDTIREGLKQSRIYNLTGSSAALLFALYDKPFLALESNEELAGELHRDVNFYREALKKGPVNFLPEPDGPARSGERAKAIHSLSREGSLVSSVRNLASPVWTDEEMLRRVIHLCKGMEIARENIEKVLYESGYGQVSIVSEKGEFSRRGWLLDVFPSTSETPFRIEFFGDEIDGIKSFDVDTQRSIENISELLIYPAKDPPAGTTLAEFMSGRKFFFSDSIQEREDLSCDITYFSRFSIQGDGHDAGLLSLKGLGLLPEERKSIDDLPGSLKNIQKEISIRIVSPSKGQAERLKDILRDGGIVCPVIDKTDIFKYEGNISITVGDLSSGLYLTDIMVLTEKEIFGDRPHYRAMRKSKISGLLTSLDDLRPGDFVVHKDHGIGRFTGLVQQNIEGVKEDLLLIEYDDGRLYIPLGSINKINKYHAEEGIVPKVDRIGGKTWQRTKDKVGRKVRDIAEKLVKLYAEREVSKGYSFSQDTELHREFAGFFPYEETPDQLTAIEDIKTDMESEKPMDRLVCGDVGYGKTEVAIRAAFKAVYDGLQVAVLVPTTILCEQHYRTFRTRFSGFPIHIDYLSRFKSIKERKETIKALPSGDTDIIIGTHGLLSKDIHFHKLGLLVIDEEHRFGVRQKEKIKELKSGVDVITLTATPIPRTLSMALSDIRDLSVIETPPEDRLAVKTIVSVFNESLIKEAIKRELERNGQVFFVHNRIKDIYGLADYLTRLMPSIKIAVAHGQMPERELEKAMLHFYDRTIDILLSTAIIGSGLDVPTANTIIIDRADTMGLADLYQLRGRVGRGNVRAYAYFLIPGEDIITEEAKKRLQAIQDMSYLGAGFRLALKDLEIRGAGNLLGAEQSGHIHEVGFDLYMELLEKAVAELKGIKIEEEFEPSIHLKANAFIPEDYIDDITLRLSLYRKIASAKSPDALKSIGSEMQDRFGDVAQEAKNLLNIMELKILARKLLITKMQDMQGIITVLFSHDTKVEPEDIFALRDKTDGKMKFLPDGFEINLKGFEWEKVYGAISSLFTCLLNSDNFNKIQHIPQGE
jgi:transcription-repair coupling factor (superfamily II helicase)